MGAPRIRLHAPPTGVRALDVSLGELEALRTSEEVASRAGPEAADLAELHARRAALDALGQRLAQAAEELESGIARMQAELPACAVKLAVGIAQELLRVELNAGNYDIEAIVRKVLATADTGRGACTIHLHPEDLEALDSSHFRSNTRFESDPDIARGDVHVTTPQGILVRDVDASLARVREALMEALE